MSTSEQALESPNATISAEAEKQLKAIIAQQDPKKDLFLRLFVQSSGTAISFGMALDANQTESDHWEVHESGLKVVVDNISFPYLKDASVSYVIGERTGFSITSPNQNLLAGASCSACSGDAGCC